VAQKAGPHIRTALAAKCGERVLPIYEEYWVGDYYPAVGRSIEIGWDYACGAAVDETELRTCLDHVRDLVSYYHDEKTNNDLLAPTVTVVLRVLQSVTPDEEASCLAVARSVLTSVDTAMSAEVMANWYTPSPARKELAAAEEKAWQQAALSLISGWEGGVTRTMFDSLGALPPEWFLDWMARSVR